ncbi:MAG TPA: hypothetical protein VGI46_01375 [Candidatus Acidoferrum sp.]|jgi:hypothetical protein
MKKPVFPPLAASLLLLGSSAFAQATRTPQHAPDGGTRETFASIFIPSTPDAPFTATVNTEWIRQLPDGNSITLKNHRTIARDTTGRIFQERRYFVPDDGKKESFVTQTEISDPASHELYICLPREQVCRLRQFFGANIGSAQFAGASAKQPGAPADESLGTQTIEGLEAIGTRETTLTETGAVGNNSPILEKREFWYSPQLGINLITKRQDARFSSQQNFEVTGIALGEPDAKLFAPPAGYRILDMRNPPELTSPTASSKD